MYRNIFKIVLKNRIDLKLNFVIRILKKININIQNKYILLFIFIFLNYLGCIFIALGFHFLLIDMDPRLLVSLIFIITFFKQFFLGITEYKSTFIFLFQDLKDMSLATDKKVYITLLIINLAYQVIINSELFLAAMMIFIIFGIKLNSIIHILNLVSISLFFYICGNLISGKYIYSKITKKIGVLRFIVYLFFTVLTWNIVFNAVKGVIYYVNELIINNFIEIEDILKDSLWENAFKGIEDSFFWILYEIQLNLINFFSLIKLESFLLVIAIIIIILYKVKINMIPKGENIQVNYKNDVFYNYYKLIRKSDKFVNKNRILLKYQVNNFLEYRWLFANSFFELFFINYEATCYTALFTSCLANSKSIILSFQLIICMSVMVLANQSFELRANAYAYFSLTVEKYKIELMKTSVLEKDDIFKVKLKCFRFIYMVHVAIMILYSIIIGVIFKLSIISILIIVVLDIILFFIMSQIQMHMVPIITNFDHIDESQIGNSLEEDEIANKLQELPRIFLVVFPMILTLLMTFIPQLRLRIVIYIELTYLIVCGVVLHKYMTNIIRKGMNNLYEKISNL